MAVSFGSGYPSTPAASVAGKPKISGQPEFYQTSLGSQVGNSLYNPDTEKLQRTGAQKGTDAGQALKALAEASGLNLLGSSSSSGSGSGGAGGSVAPIAYPNTTAAQAATFGRAKDQTGQNTRASLTALSEQMAGRGLLGSGIEAAGMGEVIGRAGQGMNELTREQAIQDVETGNRRAETEYQGRITQRGQDLNTAQAAAARQQQSLQGLLSVINSSGILY